MDHGYFQEGSLVLPTPHTQHTTTPHARIPLETVFPQKNQKMSQIPQVAMVVLQVMIVILRVTMITLTEEIFTYLALYCISLYV